VRAGELCLTNSVRPQQKPLESRGDFTARLDRSTGSGTPRTTGAAFAEMIEQAKFFHERSSRQLLTKPAFAPQDFRHLEYHDSPRRIGCLWSALR
jgi:hypothetical protein